MTLSLENEQDVLKKCQSGNSEAFGLLYEVYADKIYRFLFYRVFSREIAEDLTSKTFMKALESICSYDSKKGVFGAWLYRIARNVFIDHYRAEHSTVDIEEIFSLGEEDHLFEQSDAKEQLKKAWDYLQTLPNEQRNVVIMRVWDGLSYREIAEIIGKSEGNCKVIFSRTIAKIQKEMPLVITFFSLYLFY